MILSLDRVTAGRGRFVLQNVSWRLREGELWAVVGPNGAGKSSLLRVLRRQVPITSGELRYGRNARGRALAADPVRQVQVVSFGAQQDLLKGAAGYAQSRWHAGQDDAAAYGRDLLRLAPDVAGCHRIVDALALDAVLDRRVTELSNGERRKLVLAGAAAREPAVLALDNPSNGLDGPARASVSESVERLHREGLTVLVLTSREDEIPGAATHVLLLDRGRVVISGPKEDVLADASFAEVVRRGSRRAATPPGPTIAPSPSVPAEAGPVVRLRRVAVTYGTTRVLHDVSWTVRRGERWVVVGPNGAGKSALLSLIIADNPQAYANDVSLFGRRRGSGDTIWEIRRRIGSVSPEMHLYHELDHRVVDVLSSSLREAVVPQGRVTARELRTAEEWMVALDLESFRDRYLAELSEGERQLVLLGRALAKGPELLVLDEPCQGLDPSRRRRFLDLLERMLLASDTTLIYVTHDLDEVPAAVTHGLLLRNGRSVLEGSAREVLGAFAAR